MKRIRRAFFAAALAATLLPVLSSGTALAQGSDADADRLFKEGQKLMEEKRFGEACPKFEAVYKKDNQLGTLLNLAYCHKEQGAVWLAWLEFKEAEIKAGELKRSEKREFAKQRMTELEKSLARAQIEGQDRVELTDVLVEDRRVPDAEKGTTFAAEPGQRRFTFRAKGKKPVTQMVTITKTNKAQKIPVPEMEEAPKEPPPVEKTPEKEPKEAPVAPQKDESDGSTQRAVGIGIGALGVVGLVIGGIAGITAMGSECANHAVCTPDKAEDAQGTARIADIGLIAGGIAVAGGALLYFLAPKGSSSSTRGARSTPASGSGARIVPSLGAGWAGVHGSF